MKSHSRMLTVTVFTVLTVILLLTLMKPPKPTPVSPAESLPAPAVSAKPVMEMVPAVEQGHKFFFDVFGHSPDEFRALLRRAQMIYQQSDDAARAELEVVVVLHGPDIRFFATNETGEYDDIVNLAAKLDAFGVFDFKLCAATASRLEVAESEVPAFIEFVPYGPQEIDRLKEAGFISL